MKSSAKMIVKSALAVLSLWGLQANAQLIEKTGACPTLTRYTPSEDWTTFPIEPNPSSTYPTGTVQNPLTPQQSINCVQVPVGLKAQIVASELTPGTNSTVNLAYLMHYTFDERGRVWAIDTRDYPYTHYTSTGAPASPGTLPSNRLAGQSRIVILEDTSGDGAIDRFKVFFTGLALPTSIEVVKNGVIVTVPPNIYYISKNGLNPDTASTAVTVVTGMGSSGTSYDSHGQPNSLTRGLDNFIYGHTGYNNCGSPVVGGNAAVSCASGNIYRFKATAIGSDTNVFQIHSTNGPSNAHGIGQMEDGQFFKSGATGSSHNNHQVRHGTGATSVETESHYYPLTQDRYLWEGSTTGTTSGFNSTNTSAASGHDFYTGRLLPQKYWNRFSFVCEGASKLCNQDSLVMNGATWSAVRMPGPVRSNIFASTDAWTAPLKVRSGPDGALWVNDWYNYLFLHNPATPATMSAWNNALRAKTRTRLYRIVPADGSTDTVLNLSNRTNADLVATFWNRNFFWRLQAQRLLIERGFTSDMGDLLDSVLTRHRSVDAVGIDGPVLHALWTLHGLKQFSVDSARWNPKLRALLLHPAWTVRRNVALAMPGTGASYESIREQCAVNDVHPHARVQAMQALTRMPASGAVITSVDGLRTAHISDAYTAAGTGKVTSVTGSARPGTCPAYSDTVNFMAGYPGAVVGVSRAVALQAFPDVRFDMRSNGFDLVASDKLVGGEITVTDLRGHMVFRSTYNKTTRTWSQPSAGNLSQPFYFYTFQGVNGSKFGGRISMVQTY